MLLGSSGGNNNDFDEKGNTIVDCCSGDYTGVPWFKDAERARQYLLRQPTMFWRAREQATPSATPSFNLDSLTIIAPRSGGRRRDGTCVPR